MPRHVTSPWCSTDAFAHYVHIHVWWRISTKTQATRFCCIFSECLTCRFSMSVWRCEIVRFVSRVHVNSNISCVTDNCYSVKILKIKQLQYNYCRHPRQQTCSHITPLNSILHVVLRIWYTFSGWDGSALPQRESTSIDPTLHFVLRIVPATLDSTFFGPPYFVALVSQVCKFCILAAMWTILNQSIQV